MSRRKLIREIERRAGNAIVAITHTGGGHLCLHLASGARVFAASTPSCPFAIQHILGDIRRAQHQGGHRAH